MEWEWNPLVIGDGLQIVHRKVGRDAMALDVLNDTPTGGKVPVADTAGIGDDLMDKISEVARS
jgi:hypothetical protein